METPRRTVGKRGGDLTGKVVVRLPNGFHVNSNTPADAYLIPLRLTWNPDPLQVDEVIYPKPRLENYSFSDKPVSVFTGAVDITTRFRVPAGAAAGPAVIGGKLRYQACSDSACFPPKTLEVRLPVYIE